VTFIFFIIASVASTAIFSLITPFVADFWLGENYTMEMSVVAICVMNFCFFTISMPIQMMMGVTGLFNKERNISIIVAIVNLVLSLALVGRLGIVGVATGTFASYFVQMAYRIKVFFHEYIEMNCGRYVFDIIQYCVVSLFDVGVVYLITTSVYQKNFLSFLLIIVIAGITPLLIDGLIYCRSWRFQSILSMAKELVGNRKK
jgi:O-antigen/teichoic acid export membrane protein